MRSDDFFFSFGAGSWPLCWSRRKTVVSTAAAYTQRRGSVFCFCRMLGQQYGRWSG